MYIDENICRSVLTDYEFKGSFNPGDYHFSVDSRTIQAHELFVPFRGEITDGHAYLAQALEKGAGALVAYTYASVAMDLLAQENYKHAFIILVENPEKAFFDLVRAWRHQLTLPFVGITGSLGKTSTKLILGHIAHCAEKKVFVSHANQNTLIGIALNISKVQKDHEIAIFEMGISQVGEMQTMALFLQPTYAVITCIAHSHIAGLGSYACIAQEKRAIFSAFNQANIGCINGDQSELKNVAYAHPVVSFGFKMHNHIQARKLRPLDDKLTFVLRIYDKKYDIILTQNHKGLVLNTLAATAIAHVMGISSENIVRALNSLPIRSQRFEQRQLAGQKGYIIDDCYNACPESMKVALTAFHAIPFQGKKIAILADMLELGDKSFFWHRQLGRFLKNITSLDTVIFVGPYMTQACHVAPTVFKKEQVTCWQDALERVQLLLGDNVMVLVKGSNGMQLHHVVTALAKHN